MTSRSWLLIILAAIFTGLLEATFISLLPTPWREIRPIIEGAVLLIVLNKPRGALVFAGLSGFCLDLFSVGDGTLALVRLVLLTAAISALAHSWLTNRSIYATAALVVGARFLDRLWLWMSYLVGRAFSWDIRLESTASFFTTLAWDIGLVSLAFVALTIFTRRFLVTVRLNRFYDEL